MWKVMKWSCGCFGILFVSLMLLIIGVYVYEKWFWEEWPPERIERVSGVRVPSYKIIERHEGSRSFIGDYENIYDIEFKTMPSDELFDEIDKMIASGNTEWHKDGNKYSFSVIWGNGFPTPEGENEQDDGTFCITLTRGEKGGLIRSGAW